MGEQEAQVLIYQDRKREDPSVKEAVLAGVTCLWDQLAQQLHHLQTPKKQPYEWRHLIFILTQESAFNYKFCSFFLNVPVTYHMLDTTYKYMMSLF